MARVAVVTPCYNGRSFVATTIGSVRAQSLEDWEHIVVDDGSTDDSADVALAAMGGDPRCRLVRQPNGGVSVARNRGAAETTAEYVLFLDADDVLEPAMLSTAVGYLDAHADVDAVYTDFTFVDPDGVSLGTEAGQWPWQRCVATRWWVKVLPRTDPTTPFESIFLVAAMLPSVTVMRRETFTAAGGWDETFGQICEDTDLFLRLALRGAIHYLPQPLVQYRRHPSQATRSIAFADAYQRLGEKWRSMPPASERDRELVRQAFWFRERRFYPYRNVSAGLAALRRGKLRAVAREGRSFLRSYSPGRPPALLYVSGRDASRTG